MVKRVTLHRACSMLMMLLAFVSFAAEAALEPIPAVDMPQAIEEEIVEVRELVGFMDELVETAEQQRLEQEQRLIAEENSVSGQTADIAALRQARSELDGLETRISTMTARRAQLNERRRLVDEALGVAARSNAAARSLRDVVHQVAAEKLRLLQDELRRLDHTYGAALDVLGQTAALTRDHLNLIQSRLRVAGFDATATLEGDPRHQLVAGMIDRLLDQGLRLRLDAAQMAPSGAAGQARVTQLEFAGEAAIIRSNLRLVDLELLRSEARRQAVASLGEDAGIPGRALRHARSELNRLGAQLEGLATEARAEARRLASMEATLARRLATTGAPPEALLAARAEVGDLRPLAALQLEDIAARRAELEVTRAALEGRIDATDRAALLRHVALPEDGAGWQRAGLHLLHMPLFAAHGLGRGALATVQGQSGIRSALLVGVLLAAGAAAFALRRLAVRGEGEPHLGWRALKAAGWLLVLPAAWLLIALIAGWPPGVTAAGSGLLALPALAVMARSAAPGIVTLGRWERALVVASIAMLALWLIALPLALAPAVADIMDRLALLALAALAWLALTRLPLAALAGPIAGIRLPLIRRLPLAAPVYAVRLLALAVIGIALLGLVGYTPLAAFLLTRLAGAVVVLAVVLLALAVIERLGLAAVLALRRRNAGTAAFWRRGVVKPAQRILTISVLLAGLQVLIALMDGEALPPAALWIAIVLGTLPFVMQLVDVVVTYVLAPEQERTDMAPTSLRVVLLQRVGRAVVIIASVLLVIALFSIDLEALASPASMRERIARGVLDLLVVLLLADLVWHAARTMLARKEHEVTHGEEADEEAARRRARLRTLLPIMRNILAIVIFVTAVLMALSSVGIEIGPLIAGAGVVGVAIGFGAQTLVRDIIAGVFFLLDDAFRIGEYVESGDVRGRVESFSLRSVKLRHHRGPLHTVPFGELGSITNYSRDWVIDKITLTVTQDSDIGLIKKLVKQIGKELLADPELSANIIEPLKSQGVYAMREDGSIQIRLKITTKPGEQFVVRRTVYERVKKAFEENGIELFRPTVQVADPSQVAAHHSHLTAPTAKPTAPG